jgi:hypothetical protein
VRQTSQAETSVADPDPLIFVSHHLGGNIHQRPLSLWDHFASTLPTVNKHKLMQPCGYFPAVHAAPHKLLSTHGAQEK